MVGEEDECVSVLKRLRLLSRRGQSTHLCVCVRGVPGGGGESTHVCVCIPSLPRGEGRGRIRVYALTASPVVKGEDVCVCMWKHLWLPPLSGEEGEGDDKPAGRISRFYAAVEFA